MKARRIVSLLPSATEICFALELDDRVVGVSHECDFPLRARGRPVLTAPKIDPSRSSSEIDRQVRSLVADGLSVYRIDEERLAELRPDLVITQDACEVCAVSLEEVREATRRVVGGDVEVLSLSPLSLDDVLNDILRVGAATGTEGRAAHVVRSSRRRLSALRRETRTLERRTVVALEWLDPPMVSGHWTPELIRIGGGEPILGHDRAATGPVPWETIVDAGPEVVLVFPCGFKTAQSLAEMPAFAALPGFFELPAVESSRVVVLDGNAYFNRPGPRLVESAELAAVAVHPEAFDGRFELDPESLVRWQS